DDGQGLNRERILEKARKAGLLTEAIERDYRELLFAPGFSTATSVTDVSGRGVGLDVVRKTIGDLHGTIETRSEEHQGTTFEIRLPLTLAMIDGMVVEVGPERYVIPVQSIVRCIQVEEEGISTVLNRDEMILVNDQPVPLIRLHQLLKVPGVERGLEDGIVVVVTAAERTVGFLVDALVGHQQIVVKNIGHRLASSPGVASGTILADGLVGLILDVEGLSRKAIEVHQSRTEALAR
ncbi:MAG: chemotaxis protein CheW, partial [Verrucomicrobiota bacterium]